MSKFSNSPNKNIRLGKQGEDLVAHNLEQNGFSILARNYRKRYGEIDVIATKGDLLVFIEVKTRRNPLFDTTEVITPRKQQKMIMVAKEFLASHAITDKACRFDVAILEKQKDTLHITYIENAFTE